MNGLLACIGVPVAFSAVGLVAFGLALLLVSGVAVLIALAVVATARRRRTPERLSR